MLIVCYDTSNGQLQVGTTTLELEYALSDNYWKLNNHLVNSMLNAMHFVEASHRSSVKISQVQELLLPI